MIQRQWFGDARRVAEIGVSRWVEEMEVPGKRKASASQKTWRDIVR